MDYVVNKIFNSLITTTEATEHSIDAIRVKVSSVFINTCFHGGIYIHGCTVTEIQ